MPVCSKILIQSAFIGIKKKWDRTESFSRCRMVRRMDGRMVGNQFFRLTVYMALFSPWLGPCLPIIFYPFLYESTYSWLPL